MSPDDAQRDDHRTTDDWWRWAMRLTRLESQIIRYARPEWIEGLDDVAAVREADATIGASDRHASLTVFERSDALRLREAQGTLSREERDELDGLYARLDEEDRARLGSGEEGLLEGLVVGDTPEGRFYIERLRLNRPSLVDLRRVRRLVARARALDEALRLRIEAARHDAG